MEDSLSPPTKQTPRVLKVLEALKQASRDLRSQPTPDPTDSNSSAINALLELQTESDTILSTDPHLSSLSSLLYRLKSLVHSSRNPGHGLTSFLTRRVSAHSISRVAESIESEIQAWIDRETVEALAGALREEEAEAKTTIHRRGDDEDELINLLAQFEGRVTEGFNRELQDQILKWKIFASLEAILRDPTRPRRLRERCANAIGALIRFNKDVFVGQVLMGPTVKALVGMSTACSMKVLCGLIRSIKSPLVDELEADGAIARVVASLGGPTDARLRAIALDCAMEIGYFGRKEAIDAVLGEGVVERLVEMQRSELGGPLTEGRGRDGEEEEGGRRGPFSSAVARFAVSLEVGEGLRQREKRAFKLEILRRVREACCASQAEAATILAEVLWGSSP